MSANIQPTDFENEPEVEMDDAELDAAGDAAIDDWLDRQDDYDPDDYDPDDDRVNFPEHHQ